MGAVTSKVEILHTDDEYSIKQPNMVTFINMADDIIEVFEYPQYQRNQIEKQTIMKTPNWKNIRWIRLENEKMVHHPFVPFLTIGSTRTKQIMLIANHDGLTYNISSLVTKHPKNFRVYSHLF